MWSRRRSSRRIKRLVTSGVRERGNWQPGSGGYWPITWPMWCAGLGEGNEIWLWKQSLQTAVDESSARIDAWLAAEGSSPSERAIHEERLVRLAEALASLPEDQRTAIELHHLKGVCLAEVRSKWTEKSGIGCRVDSTRCRQVAGTA